MIAPTIVPRPVHLPLRKIAAAAMTVVPTPLEPIKYYAPANLADYDSQMPVEHLLNLGISAYSALDALREGSAEEGHAAVLVDAANMSLIFCEKGLLPERRQLIVDAQNVLLLLKRRAVELQTKEMARRLLAGESHESIAKSPPPQRWICKGTELQVLTQLVATHEDQLHDERCTQAVVIYTYQEVLARAQRGHVVVIQ